MTSYARKVKNQIESNVEYAEIDIELKLTAMAC